MKSDKDLTKWRIKIKMELSSKELSIGDLASEMNISTQTLWNRLNGLVKDWEAFKDETESALKRL